jgi:hypothetical protein
MTGPINLLCTPGYSGVRATVFGSTGISTGTSTRSSSIYQSRLMIRTPQLERQHDRIAQINATVIGQNKSHHEELFIETCINELMADSDLVSQTKFAAFIIQYCRKNEDVRGPECTNALFFFKDLPNEIQLEFLRHSEDVCPFDVVDSDDSLLQDCLDELNAKGGLFFVGTDRTSALCTSTFDLMILANLILNITTYPATSAPLSTSPPNAPIAPTSAPLNVLRSQLPTIDHNLDHENDAGLSSVGILGIVITALFVILFLIQCILFHLRKRSSKNGRLANDVIALREDESVVASEHSHELLSPIAAFDNGSISASPKNRDHSVDPSLTPTDDFDSQSAIQSGGRFIRAKPKSVEQQGCSRQKKSTTPRSATSVPRFRIVSFDSTRTSHSNDTTQKFLYPHPLITENLSDGNPVLFRKRFHKKLAGIFSFDEDDTSRFDDTSNNNISNKMTPAIPILQAGKENDVTATRNVQGKSTNSSGKHAAVTMRAESK